MKEKKKEPEEAREQKNGNRIALLAAREQKNPVKRRGR